MKPLMIVFTLSSFLVAGCDSSSSDAGFGDVQTTILDRTGRQVQWIGRSAEDKAVAKSVRTMLANELNCDQAVQIALLNNRHLQATFEDLGIAQADLVQAGLLKNPVFDLSVRIPDSRPARTYLDLAVAEDFLDVALLPARKQVASEQLEQAKAKVTDEVLSLTADTATAFYSYQAAQQNVELHQQIVQAATASLNAARKLHEAGNMNDLDFFSQQAEAARAQLELENVETDADDARERLTSLMGLSDEQIHWKAVSVLPDIPAKEISIGGLETLAMRQRQDLAAARKDVEIQARKLGMTSQYRFFQDLDLGPEAERETDGQWRIGPTLSIPIPLFDQGQGQVGRAGAMLRQSEQRLIAMETDARSQVRAASRRLLNARARVLLYRDEILPVQRELLQQTQLHYNGMFVGVFQLLQARRDQINSAGEFIQTLRDYWTARVELERAIGGRLPDASATQPAGDRP